MNMLCLGNSKKIILVTALTGTFIMIGTPVISLADENSYFDQREKKLDSNFKKQKEIPVIEKKEKKDSEILFNQKITFSALNEKTGKPYSKANVLGNGKDDNKGSLSLNIFSEFSNSTYSESTQGAYDLDNKNSGLSIFENNDTDSAKPIYFSPDKTNFYSVENEDGTNEIKILGMASTDGPSSEYKYVVELSAVTEPDSSDVNVTAEVVNATGEKTNIGLMYTTILNNKEVLNNSNEKFSVKALADNEGLYVYKGDKTNKNELRTEIKFPGEDAPVNWTVGKENKKQLTNFNNFDEGSNKQTASSKGVEAKEELEISDDLGEKNENVVQFKSKLKEVNSDESVKMAWTMASGGVMAAAEVYHVGKPQYTEIDKQSGLDLSVRGYTRSNTLKPLKIDDSAYEKETKVVSYMSFGMINSPVVKKTDFINGKIEAKTDANKNIANNILPLSFPKIISFTKNFNSAAAGYSYDHKYSGADNPGDQQTPYGGSGFSFATFTDNGRVDNPNINIKRSILNGQGTATSRIEELYISEDQKSLYAYGYISQGGINFPVRMQQETVGTRGKVRFSLTYLNPTTESKNFGFFNAVHIDLSGEHEKSTMYTLGGMKGLYFNENNIEPFRLVGGSKYAQYYVAFFTNSTGQGAVSPNNLVVYNVTRAAGGTGMYEYGIQGREIAENPPFNRSQVKDQPIAGRDRASGEIIDTKIKVVHPGFSFVYPIQKVDTGKIARVDQDMRVSDIPSIDYSTVIINPEEDKKFTNKTDLNYQVDIEQKLDSDLVTEENKTEYLTFEFDYTNNLTDIKRSDFEVIESTTGVADKVLDPTKYQLTLDTETRKVVVTLRDPYLWDMGKSKKTTIKVKQKSKIRSNIFEDVKFAESYNKVTENFSLPISSFSRYKVLNDETEPETKLDKVSNPQLIKYIPDFKTTANQGVLVESNSDAGDASQYVTTTYNKLFDFDDVVVTYKNNVKPTFTGNGNVKFTVVAESKYFAHPVDIDVTVKVTETVKMTVKRLINDKSNKPGPIKDLSNDNFTPIADVDTRVAIAADFKPVLKKEQDKTFDGYDYKNTILKTSAGTIIADQSKVPKDDFIMELYYSGKFIVEQPTGFDFGTQKLSVTETSGVRPKISKNNSEDDTKEKMRIINTVGEDTNWNLFAKESVKMKNGQKPYNGQMFYKATANTKNPIAIGKDYIAIDSNRNNKNMAVSIPLIQNDAGIYLDIYPGNSKGLYSEGEIIWEVRNAP